MAYTPSRIGYQNLLHLFPELEASAELADQPARYLTDWLPGTLWTPYDENTVPAVPPGPDPATVDIHPIEGQLLVNGAFASWPAADPLPLGWSEVGAGGAVFRETATTKVGQVAARIEGTGAGEGVRQVIPREALLAGRGKHHSAGVWVQNVTADSARVRMGYIDADGVTEVPTAAPGTAGVGAWQFIDLANVHMPTWAKGIYLEVVSLAGASHIYVDGAALIRSDTAPAATPHAQPVDYLAGFKTNLGSTGQTLRLIGSNDNFATSVVIATVSPTSDGAFWADFAAVSYRSYRLELVGGVGSGLPSAAILAIGQLFELLRGPRIGFDPYRRGLSTDAVLSNDAAPVGRNVQPSPVTLTLENRAVPEAFIDGPLTDFWAHAGGDGMPGGPPGGLPFFLAWDSVGHPTQVFFCWFPKGANLSAPMNRGLKADVPLTFLAVRA